MSYEHVDKMKIQTSSEVVNDEINKLLIQVVGRRSENFKNSNNTILFKILIIISLVSNKSYMM